MVPFLLSGCGAERFQLKLTEREHVALCKAAKGLLLGTYVRWLVQAAAGWRDGMPECALEMAKARAEELGLPFGLYARLVVLEGAGITDLRKDAARAAKVATS